jgi:Mlc titration factor MtfA (ptsG expression regulator)
MLYILIAVIIIIGVSANFILRTKKPIIKEEFIHLDYKLLLAHHIPYYARLNAQMQERFSQKVQVFLGSVRIEGVGFQLTDADRIMVAASAVIPILNFDDWSYPSLTNVIVYPDAFNNDFQFEGQNRNIMGMVGSGFMNGQMLLSRSALIKGFASTSGKENAAIHEFVHLVDGSDGAIDGIPENLMEHASTVPWLKMIHQEMQRIKEGNSDINPYALTNEAEFLAVVAEYFFDKPDQFNTKHPELYQALAKLFNQHPAERDTILPVKPE